MRSASVRPTTSIWMCGVCSWCRFSASSDTQQTEWTQQQQWKKKKLRWIKYEKYYPKCAQHGKHFKEIVLYARCLRMKKKKKYFSFFVSVFVRSNFLLLRYYLPLFVYTTGLQIFCWYFSSWWWVVSFTFSISLNVHCCSMCLFLVPKMHSYRLAATTIFIHIFFFFGCSPSLVFSNNLFGSSVMVWWWW